MRQITEIIPPSDPRLGNMAWNRRCLLFSLQEGNRYWTGSNVRDGVTANIEEARIFNIREVRGMVLRDERTQIHLFEEVPANGRKCLINQVLSGTVIELLKMAPLNETARAHALSQLTVPIPAQCQTFEQIRDWVENNVDPSSANPVPQTTRALTIDQALQRMENVLNQDIQDTTLPPAPPVRPDPFGIAVSVTETENGRCTYSCDRSGEELIGVSIDQITDAVSRAIERGHGLTWAVDELQATILDEAEVDTEPDGYDYDDFETTETTDRNKTLNTVRLRQILENYLRNSDPETLETLANNE